MKFQHFVTLQPQTYFSCERPTQRDMELSIKFYVIYVTNKTLKSQVYKGICDLKVRVGGTLDVAS